MLKDESGQTTIGAKVTPEYRHRIEIETVCLRKTPSDAVREGLELWLALVAPPCPVCDGETFPHPDPTMTGVRYCPACEKPVKYTPDNGKEQ